MSQARSVKLISIEQLRPAMYVQDVNCSWMDHPFEANLFRVKDAKRVDAIQRYLVFGKPMELQHG